MFAIFYDYYPINATETENNVLYYQTSYIEDGTTELGQELVKQNGENGTMETIYITTRTLSGKQLSRSKSSESIIKAPVDKVIAKGTKKFQFMWCSNGTYRYYENEQFKSPNVGFTHQSPDECSKSGNGHMTSLADAAPVQQQTTTNYPSYTRSYTPSYTPSYRSPTTCNTQYHSYGGYFDPSATTTCY